MSVWLTIPSARPPAEANKALSKWREMGYKIALWRDNFDAEVVVCDVLMIGPYEGYANSVNKLVRTIFESDPTAEWCVIGGDDVLPDPNHTAREIAVACNNHFGFGNDTQTFGAMQPTGDRFGENPNHAIPSMRGAYIDRICGSAWLGREFCRRINNGNGPLWHEYWHMFVDEALQEIAVKLGILWQRRDLTQHHQHWARDTQRPIAPKHLTYVSGSEHWKEAQAIFDRQKAEGFAEYLRLKP